MIIYLLLKECVLEAYHPKTELGSRADYWVSQKRKYCEYCKCWLADNKPSVEFHENGRRHKGNVSRRLAEMQRKATKEAKVAAKFDYQMKAIEQAAVRAYLQDAEANPDVTSQMLGGTIRDRLVEETSDEPGELVKPEFARGPKRKTKKWMEAKTAEGQTYYRHIETGKTVLEAPKEGYVSLEAQGSNLFQTRQPKNVTEMNRQIYGTGGQVTVKNEKQTFSKLQPVATRGWVPADREEVYPDLELPDFPKKEPAFVPPVPTEEEKTKIFKEKRVPVAASTSGDLNIAFKKRKLSGVRNARQRGGDD